MAGLGVDRIDLLRRCGLSGQPLGPQHSICHHTADNADQSRAHDGAELAKDIPVEYYRFDVDQSNLTDGEVWSVWLDEWEMHGNLQNIAAHVDTVYYVDGDAYTSLDDVPKAAM